MYHFLLSVIYLIVLSLSFLSLFFFFFNDPPTPEIYPLPLPAALPICRRDFTINGMFLDPDSGEVLDFVGGRADLDRRIVRAIGDPKQRFAEDKLRLLRAVRFAARLRSEEHTSELQSLAYLVCRLLL